VLKKEGNYVQQSAVVEFTGTFFALRKPSEAEADFARYVAHKPDLKSWLEQRVNQFQAQLRFKQSYLVMRDVVARLTL
jgi:hypothetical protein